MIAQGLESASEPLVDTAYVLTKHVHVAFKKISDERHALEIQRDTGEHEQVICETKSYLLHDFLHFAVESEARLESGFWGSLDHGRTLAERMADSISKRRSESRHIPSARPK